MAPPAAACGAPGAAAQGRLRRGDGVPRDGRVRRQEPLHTAHLLRLSEDLPVLLEVVDSEEHAERLKAILDEMVPEGLVTMQKVQVLRYAPALPRSS